MIIEVGQVYRGVFCGHPLWLKVTRIERSGYHLPEIHYKYCKYKLPWGFWVFVGSSSSTPNDFLQRLRRARDLPKRTKLAYLDIGGGELNVID